LYSNNKNYLVFELTCCNFSKAAGLKIIVRSKYIPSLAATDIYVPFQSYRGGCARYFSLLCCLVSAALSKITMF
jgi:hypothetical protein